MGLRPKGHTQHAISGGNYDGAKGSHFTTKGPMANTVSVVEGLFNLVAFPFKHVKLTAVVGVAGLAIWGINHAQGHEGSGHGTTSAVASASPAPEYTGANTAKPSVSPIVTKTGKVAVGSSLRDQVSAYADLIAAGHPANASYSSVPGMQKLSGTEAKKREDELVQRAESTRSLDDAAAACVVWTQIANPRDAGTQQTAEYVFHLKDGTYQPDADTTLYAEAVASQAADLCGAAVSNNVPTVAIP